MARFAASVQEGHSHTTVCSFMCLMTFYLPVLTIDSLCDAYFVLLATAESFNLCDQSVMASEMDSHHVASVLEEALPPGQDLPPPCKARRESGKKQKLG